MSGEPPKYVIVSEADAPHPDMVCQWVPGVGYCYLDRTSNKTRHDGMAGTEATPVEAFSIDWVESDRIVVFYKTDKPPTATYRDGLPRRWHSSFHLFVRRRLTAKDVKKKAGMLDDLDEDAVERVAMALVHSQGFGWYDNPMDGGQDAYNICLAALDDARVAIAAYLQKRA